MHLQKSNFESNNEESFLFLTKQLDLFKLLCYVSSCHKPAA